MFNTTNKLDWAMGELLHMEHCFRDINVRLSGQDVERGTFSHRHAVLKAEASEEELILLNQINSQAKEDSVFIILLSEYGVLDLIMAMQWQS